jgi:hypothetical protein
MMKLLKWSAYQANLAEFACCTFKSSTIVQQFRGCCTLSSSCCCCVVDSSKPVQLYIKPRCMLTSYESRMAYTKQQQQLDCSR